MAATALVCRRTKVCALLFLLLAVFSIVAHAGNSSGVAVGVFAFQGEQAAISDWSPVIDHLNRELPGHGFHLHNYDADGLREAIAAKQVDLVITNPGYYVTLEAQFGLSRIATLQSPHAARSGQALGSVVLARAERTELVKLRDLAGRSIAAVAPEAFGGYLIAAREMLRDGVDPESAVRETRFLGLPMTRIVEAVIGREVDAGIVRACLPEQMAREGLIRMEEFRVLSPRYVDGFDCALSSPLYPDWPIAVTRHLDSQLAKSLARVLLAMPEGQDRVSWSVPSDYQQVLDLYRDLRVGPYAYLRDITPEGMARRFWPWLLGLLALLAVWIVHTVRVEHLVHQRTRELNDSLAARDAAERRVRDNQERMEHLSRLSILGELSGSLAHEINQPLTSIGTYANSLLRRDAAGTLTPDALREACGEIASEAERAGGVVQRIRHFARKRVAVREPVDLFLLIEEARRMVAGMLISCPKIAVEREAGLECRVLCDGLQIQQVLLNLIKNAIDAARGLPDDRQVIRVRLTGADNRLVVHVIDLGAGLDAAQRMHLFEPFFTTKPDGLGLGLPICRSIIEAHGGRLWADANEDGVGMCFSFQLPCHESSA